MLYYREEEEKEEEEEQQDQYLKQQQQKTNPVCTRNGTGEENNQQRLRSVASWRSSSICFSLIRKACRPLNGGGSLVYVGCTGVVPTNSTETEGRPLLYQARALELCQAAQTPSQKALMRAEYPGYRAPMHTLTPPPPPPYTHRQ